MAYSHVMWYLFQCHHFSDDWTHNPPNPPTNYFPEIVFKVDVMHLWIIFFSDWPECLNAAFTLFAKNIALVYLSLISACFVSMQKLLLMLLYFHDFYTAEKQRFLLFLVQQSVNKGVVARKKYGPGMVYLSKRSSNRKIFQGSVIGINLNTNSKIIGSLRKNEKHCPSTHTVSVQYFH